MTKNIELSKEKMRKYEISSDCRDILLDAIKYNNQDIIQTFDDLGFTFDNEESSHPRSKPGQVKGSLIVGWKDYQGFRIVVRVQIHSITGTISSVVVAVYDGDEYVLSLNHNVTVYAEIGEETIWKPQEAKYFNSDKVKVIEPEKGRFIIS